MWYSSLLALLLLAGNASAAPNFAQNVVKTQCVDAMGNVIPCLTVVSSGTISVDNFPPVQVISSSSSTAKVTAYQGGAWTATVNTATATFVTNFPTVQAVSGPLTNTELRASSVPVTSYQGGTWNVNTLNASTSTVISSGSVTAYQGTSPWVVNLTTSVIVSNLPAVQAVSGPLTDAQLRASSVPVAASQAGAWSVTVLNASTSTAISGTVTVNQGTTPWTVNLTTSVVVSNFPATQAVTGPLTDAQLRASSVPVAASQAGAWTATVNTATSTVVSNFPATQVVSGTVAATQGTSPWVVNLTTSVVVSNFPATQAVTGPLTNTELRASSVPVTAYQGGVWIATTVVSNFPATQAVTGPLTNTELRASSVTTNAFQGGVWVNGISSGTATVSVTNNRLDVNSVLSASTVAIRGSLSSVITSTTQTIGTALVIVNSGRADLDGMSFVYKSTDNMVAGSTLTLTGFANQVDIQAIDRSCTFKFNGGDDIKVEQNTGESYNFDYTLSNFQVLLSTKNVLATCKVRITGAN